MERCTIPMLFRIKPVPISSTSLRDASETGRTLPRAKNSPPDCFYGSFCCRRPFESRPSNQKRVIPNGITRFWYAGRDSNPQPSEPESDALSIEPPAHLLYSLDIIAGIFPFVKRETEIFPQTPPIGQRTVRIRRGWEGLDYVLTGLTQLP